MEKKTYKRELGALMFLWLIYLTETKEIELVATLAPPIFMYIAFAMGADVYSKLQQPGFEPPTGRWSKGGSKHPTREEQLPDDWDIPNYGTIHSEASSEDHKTISRQQQS